MDIEERRNLRYTRGAQPKANKAEKPADIDSSKMDAKAKKDAEKAAKSKR